MANGENLAVVRQPLPTTGLARETYLLVWNPKRFEWEGLDDQIRAVQEKGKAQDRWSCGRARNIPPGSRFFLIRLGTEPRGIVGSGYTLGEVGEAPHWNDERANQGETTHYVEVQFDALSRTPLIRRAELDEEPFAGFKWDTQMSGVRVPDEMARLLDEEWQRRLAARSRGEVVAPVAAEAIEPWRERWQNAGIDTAWMERQRLRDEKRREALPQIRDLVVRFLQGQASLSEFRDTFDRKTRNEWDLFGLKGLSGAMFLNKLAKHLPEEDEVSQELRKALAVPENDAEARDKIAGLMAFLDRQIEADVATSGELQPNRAPFFVSACWHVQAPETWPIMYQSARTALQADGLLGRLVKGADGYLEFARVFKALATGISIPFWDLEHLCVRLDSSADSDEPGGAEEQDEAPQRERVWLIAPGQGANLFDEFYREGIVAIGWDFLGDISEYSDADQIRDAIQQHRGGSAQPTHAGWACYQFAHEMEVGDVVFAKRGRKEIVGYGVITSEYRYEPGRQRFKHVRSVDWKKRGEWVARERPLVTKTLTEIGKYPGLVADIRRALGIEEEQGPVPEKETVPSPGYSVDDAMQELFLARADVEEAIELLRYKKNLVLQGPPGVGKTFFAKRLAYLLLEEKDPDRVAQVQFHQSYSYEDFVQGYRPVDGGGFARVDGPFMRFCDQALQDPASPYVLIIDEINRGNLSKIFGELLLLIEADKRSEVWATTLAYSKEGETPFYVPKNVHIIGTMNTADRSLAMVDYALRRRFAFVDVQPGYRHAGFARKLVALGADATLRDRIIARLERLNDRIAKDPSFGSGFCIGHSYFCQTGGGTADEVWFKRIVRTEIEPFLREYWFDQQERVANEIAQLLDDD